MNRREAAIVHGLLVAHRALIDAIERSLMPTARTSTPATAGAPPSSSPPLEPLNAEDDTEVELADVCTAAEIEQLRELAETLSKATREGSTMPRYIARFLKEAYAEE